jgi:hypothetical protein
LLRSSPRDSLAAMAQRAQTLSDALTLLDPRPLAFGQEVTNAAEDPGLYEPVPGVVDQGLHLPGPIEAIQKRLLKGGRETKMFLSGHVGSGKSTELARLGAQPKIRGEFSVVTLRFEEQEWATLDSSQVLFRMAGALFAHGLDIDRIEDTERLNKVLQSLDGQLHGGKGTTVREGTLKAEYNLLFVKITQDLKLSEGRRRQFRDLGETLKSVLLDLLNELTDNIENQLARHEEPAKLLVVVDDLDKVRSPENQRDIFETHLNSLLVLPFRAVYTVPSGVAFGSNYADLRQNKVHLYPIKVLARVYHRDPEQAYLAERFGFFRHLVDRRVVPALITDEAVRLATLYSGGVLRDFFRILREGIHIAEYNDMDVLDGPALRAALRSEKLRESAGLYLPDFKALAMIHQTHQLGSDANRRYLDEGRVIECYNDKNWFEVNPLLWSILPDPEDGTPSTSHEREPSQTPPA